MRASYAVIEHDPSPDAIVEARNFIKPADVPRHCVLCFFHEVIATLEQERRAVRIHSLECTYGPQAVHTIHVAGCPVALVHPGVGAPMAALTMEKLIALGCRTFVAVGGAGVLDRDAALGHAIIPSAAVRDEGTSYQYLPPSREVTADPLIVQAIRDTLESAHLAYTVGKTWTTDGFFRETAARVALRKAEGCITVEMEAAAFFAVAQFRKVSVGQILYAGDIVHAAGWDARRWQHASCREQLLWLAAEACLRIPDRSPDPQTLNPHLQATIA